jgi:hypothetical protein
MKWYLFFIALLFSGIGLFLLENKMIKTVGLILAVIATIMILSILIREGSKSN